MSCRFTLERLAIAAVALVAGVACFASDDNTPPPGKAEDAVPAVDLQKAKKDKQLARQAEKNQDASKGNLQEIGLAVHKFIDDTGFLPDDVTDKKGKALLSWRVAILPHIQQDALYKQFKLDEPWDSPHNKKLLAQMPKIYAPVKNAVDKHSTFYQVFTGPKTMFDGSTGTKIQNITDGTANTLMVVEGGTAVPWTKPADLEYKAGQPLPKLGGQFKGGFNLLLADGSVRFVSSHFDPDVMRLLITINDGEVIDYNRLNPPNKNAPNQD